MQETKNTQEEQKSNDESIAKGPIAWMATNPVAANLLMFVMLVGGLIMAMQIKQEIFPEFTLDTVTVVVTVPGASPEEVEKGVVMSVENAVQSLEGIKEITATASEGSGRVVLELEESADPNKVLQDVKSEVDRITTFPVDAEPAEVTLDVRRIETATLVLTGSDDPLVLREWAEITRDSLLRSPGITQVELTSVLDHEIAIEVPMNVLRRYNLSLGEIATHIGQVAIEQGGGTLRTDGGDVMLRFDERRDFASEFMSMPLITTPEGGQVRLEDIATVSNTFEDSVFFSEYNGQPTVMIEVYRIGEQSPKSVSAASLEVVEELNAIMPGDLQLDVLWDGAEVFTARADLLTSNALLGIALVFGCLALFLQPSLAFWVSMGIPVSFIGAFLFLEFSGVSINVMSMFAFIVALGIVVDDAIVVGENVRALREKGFDDTKASILGTREVGIPVTFSILTNIAAFFPLIFLPGTMGKIWYVVPVVVIVVFICSWVESLFILPAHLIRHIKPGAKKKRGPAWFLKISQSFLDFQERFSRAFVRFVEYRYGPIIVWSLKNRYTVVALCVALLLVSLSYVATGRMGFSLMPRTESDYAYAEVTVPAGMAENVMLGIKDMLVTSAKEVGDENGGEELYEGIFATVSGSTIRVRMFLTDVDLRPLDTASVTKLWRDRVGEIPGAETQSFEADRGGPGSGKGLSIRLSHRDTATLEMAAIELGEMLENYSNLGDVDTGTASTKRQLDIELKPLAYQMGFTSRDISNQIRAAFEGQIVLRQQRGRDEVTVRVRLPEEERVRESTLEELIIKAPDGREVPLRDVVTISQGRADVTIYRSQAQRTATVAASVTPSSATNLMMQTAEQDLLPILMENYPGLSWEYAGKQADMQESLSVLYTGLAFSLLAIYVLLAIPFKSYTQPFIIMTSIPFSVVGAIGGHLIMGYSLSVISIIGMLALAGVVVNDSLVLVEFANKRREEGLPARKAVRIAGIQRFRPILLTTLTTFAGLVPLIFETSRQARMLIPVALSLGFGILFATFICLILVPALYLILDDIQKKLKG